MRPNTTETFIEKARKVHGDKYDYSKVEYINNSTKVILTCVEHGDFVLSPSKHLAGRGCRVCTKISKRSTDRKSPEEYLVEIKETLLSTGDLEKYYIGKVSYVDAKTKVILTCIKHNYTWGILPGHLRNGRRCPKCGEDFLSSKFSSNTKDFITKSTTIYGEGSYGYDKVDYIRNNINVEITCHKHGSFWVTPSHWLGRKRGCPTCSKETFIPTNKKFFPQLVEEGQDIHGIRYDYSKVDDTKSVREKQEIVCPKHGSWFVTMDNHLNFKSGCPSCVNKVSIAEREIGKFIRELGYEFLANQPILKPYHIDIYIPELKLGIEYCGVYYHGELRKKDPQYHLRKFLLAKEKGIYLIQIFEDEWIKTPEIVKDVLRTKLGKTDIRNYARKFKIKEVSYSEANSFFEKVHLQGSTGSITKSYGLIDQEDKIHGIMSFTPANVKSGEIELCRFATEGSIVGGFSKLLKRSCEELSLNGYSYIISYSDNRWSIGGVYEKTGFIKVGTTAPRYWWCKGNTRHHRRSFQRKYLTKIFGDNFKEELSGAENCRANGYFRIWDAGLTKWKYNL